MEYIVEYGGIAWDDQSWSLAGNSDDDILIMMRFLSSYVRICVAGCLSLTMVLSVSVHVIVNLRKEYDVEQCSIAVYLRIY